MTPSYIVVHHSVTPRDQIPDRAQQGINRTHKARGFPKSSLGWHVAYQYIIYGNGEIRQYRQDTEPGAHTAERNMNIKSIGICLAGDFDQERPSPQQTASLKKLLQEKTAKFKIINIRPHRTYAGYKSCYGKLLSNTWAEELLEDNMKLVNDKGTVYLVTGNKDKRKIGIADLESLGMFGDEEQIPMDTSKIPEYQTIVKGQIINK